MRRPQYRSPVARAVVPVLAGIGFFVVLGLLLWGAAAYIAENSDRASDDFAPSTFDVGRTKSVAATIESGGPLIFPDLHEASGERSIVLDHTGEDVDEGWRIYLAHPADRDVTCKVVQVKKTRTFTDCGGRVVAVEDLADPPAGVFPIVSADGELTLDLLPESASTEITGTVPPTTL